MEKLTTGIDGLLILKPRVHFDARGYFFESYNAEEFERVTGIRPHFVQDNESRSTRGVVRGLHFQKGEHSQAKLVRVSQGEVLDVVVDLRKGSPTYGKHAAVRLSSENFLQLYIPRGFAHGYAVLSETAQFQYKCDNYYCPASEGGLRYDDPALGIDWIIPEDERLLSEKDLRHPLLSELEP